MKRQIQIVKINNHEVKPVPQYAGPRDVRPVLGADLFAVCYTNIVLVAKRNTGKTTCEFDIMKHCTDKDTKFILFVSTFWNDDTWKDIRAWLKKEKRDYEVYTSIKTDQGADKLKELVNEWHEIAEEEEKKQDLPKPKKLFEKKKYMYFDEEEEEKEEKKQRRKKYQTPEIMLIFDDMGKQMMTQSLEDLIKNSRHFKIKLLMGCQYFKQIKPESRENLDCWLLFRGLSNKHLEIIYEQADIPASLSIQNFIDMYHKATEKEKSFFYVDRKNEDYRINFNHKFNLK